MPNRLLLIHGYVEDATIFDRLVPLLPSSDVVLINLADEFARWQPAGSVNVRSLAQYLVNHYKITDSDVVIGHSMGGWIAVNIKQLTGAGAVQLGSWTDQRKINFPVTNLTFLRAMLSLGITQSRALAGFLIKQYPFDESRELYIELVRGTITMNRRYVWQQLQTLFALVPPLTVRPDLRIHARRDTIVFPPDEPFTEVPGDHFSLVFHAEAVAEPIRTLLANRPSVGVGG